MSKIFKLFLAGVAVGMLIAPEKGSVVRKKISRCVGDAKSRWNEFINGTEDDLASLPDERRTVDELITSSPSVTDKW